MTTRRKNDPLPLDEETIRAVAEGCIDSKTQLQISKEMGISIPSVARLKRTPEFKELAKQVFQAKLAGLGGLVAAVIERELKQGNLEAVALWLKAMGISGAPKAVERGGDQSFTIILPGATPTQLQVQAKPDIIVAPVANDMKSDGGPSEEKGD